MHSAVLCWQIRVGVDFNEGILNSCQALTPTKQIDKAHSPSPSFSGTHETSLASQYLSQAIK